MDRRPGGQCTICNHPQRVEIDKALVAGESYRSIARRFGVTDSAVGRHKRNGHILEKIAKVGKKRSIRRAKEIEAAVEEKERFEELHGEAILCKIAELIPRSLEILNKAEKEGTREACMALGEVRRTLELAAKATGELQERSAVTVNIIQSAEFRQVIAILQEELPYEDRERIAKRLYEISS